MIGLIEFCVGHNDLLGSRVKTGSMFIIVCFLRDRFADSEFSASMRHLPNVGSTATLGKPMLVQQQHWVNVSCLLECGRRF